MKWYHWTLFIVVLVPLTVIGFLLGRRHGDLSSELGTELDAIDAKAVVKTRLAEADHDQVVEEIEERYSDRIAKLDADGEATRARLRDDPVALAGWLARVGR